MAHIYLALGSNVGDKAANIETALGTLAEKVTNIDRAPLYVSKAMYHRDQADFVNTVIGGRTELEPTALLAFVKDVEQRVGRTPRFENGPREIDIDILFYDNLVLDIPVISGSLALHIPHKRIEERAFVLVPLADIAPDFVHPLLKKAIKTLCAELPPEALAEVQSFA